MSTTCKYCQLPEDKQENPGLICENCICFVHLGCLRRPGTPGDFSGDVFFDFNCEECSPDNREVFGECPPADPTPLESTFLRDQQPRLLPLQDTHLLLHRPELVTTVWTLFACTEQVHPMCPNGINDMFEPKPWNLTEWSSECHVMYGVYPCPDAARIEYGGDRLQAASNIVFSNGLLDPWSGGGILSNISESVVAVVINDGAHHLDLMPANEKDPTSVRMARQTHKQHIHKWIRAFRKQNSF